MTTPSLVRENLASEFSAGLGRLMVMKGPLWGRLLGWRRSAQHAAFCGTYDHVSLRSSISQCRRLVQYPHHLQGTEASMRMFIVLAVAVAIVAIGFGVKAVFVPGSSAVPGLMTGAMTTSNTLSPHEIHLNYEGMKELPVHEIKDPN